MQSQRRHMTAKTLISGRSFNRPLDSPIGGAISVKMINHFWERNDEGILDLMPVASSCGFDSFGHPNQGRHRHAIAKD
jgi:hypothetical protein